MFEKGGGGGGKVFPVCFPYCPTPIHSLCRRQSYKKKLSYLSFDEGKFIT